MNRKVHMIVGNVNFRDGEKTGKGRILIVVSSGERCGLKRIHSRHIVGAFVDLVMAQSFDLRVLQTAHRRTGECDLMKA